jgi:predicted TIM-barrel fold metal-dependent hydrolase
VTHGPSGANRLFGAAGEALAGPVDAHVHLYTNDLPMVAGRRYTPATAATLAMLADRLRAGGLAGALVVQPSFLGTDNAHLLACLAAAARDCADLTLRGVAVLDPATPADEMARLAAAGIAGLRLNLVGGAALPDLAQPVWQRHLAAANDLGWQVELHLESPRLPALLPALLDACAHLVVDHFGRPDPVQGLACPGMRALLAAPADRITVKLSAPYRSFPTLSSDEAAAYCIPFAQALADRFGRDRLAWGSDWPWTQFEDRHSYAQALAWRDLWFP